MYSAKKIQERIRELKHGPEVVRPPQQTVEWWLTAPSSKIRAALPEIKSSRTFESGVELDYMSLKYFEYCWTKVDSFSGASLNAVEIGYLTSIPPIAIAIYIEAYGQDWGMKMFEAKRIARKDRGKYTVLRFFDCFTTVDQILIKTDDKRVRAQIKKEAEGGFFDAIQDYMQTPALRKIRGGLGANMRIFSNPKLRSNLGTKNVDHHRNLFLEDILE